MRPVYMISGGITKFAKAHPDKDFRLMVKEAGQLKAGAMVQDYLGLCPKPSRRIEGGGATGGLCFQSAWEAVASGRMELCVAMGFETMSRVNTWKGNEFIALASDTNFDYPVGGFYTGYYAMMVRRHMFEFGTTVEQMAKVAVKNHANALHNPYAQSPELLTVADVRSSPMVATPLTIRDCCQMSDGAAVAILASERMADKLGITPVRVSGVGCGTDAMRMADRHQMAGITDPGKELDFVELHDAYTSSEIQTYEDLGLCRYGEGGSYVDAGAPFLPTIDYGLRFSGDGRWGRVPVNPSGGLLACGHPVGATGLMQAVFAFWQLQETIGKHLGDARLQIPDARRGLIHSHAGTGTYITVSIMEKI